MSNMIETAYSYVNAWQCDEVGHYNTQFYFADKTTADAHLRLALGLSPVNRPEKDIWIRVADSHVRFHAELRKPDCMRLQSAIVEYNETSALACHEIINTVSGALSAAFTTNWQCQESKTGKATPWPQNARSKFDAAQIELPIHAKRRSVLQSPKDRTKITLSDAESAGLTRIYKTMVRPEHCDVGGILAEQHYLGRMTEGAPQIWSTFGISWSELSQRGIGTILLEVGLEYGSPVHAGDLLEFRSGVREVGRKTFGVNTFAFNSETGACVAAFEATTALLDLTTRKSVEPPPELREKFNKHMISF